MSPEDFFKTGHHYRVTRDFSDYTGKLITQGTELTFIKLDYSIQGEGYTFFFHGEEIRLETSLQAEIIQSLDSFFQHVVPTLASRLDLRALSTAKLSLNSRANGYFEIEVQNADGKSTFYTYDERSKGEVQHDLLAALSTGENLVRITYGAYPKASWKNGEVEFKLMLQSKEGEKSVTQNDLKNLSSDSYIITGTRPFTFTIRLLIQN